MSTLTFSHEGEDASETKLDIYGVIKDTRQNDVKNQQVNLKAVVINGPASQSGMMCLNIDNSLRTNWEDPLAFTGQSEPSINQSISLTLGKFPSGQPNPQTSVQDLPCLSNHAEITFTGEAQRSEEQSSEAEASATWPYNQCQAEKASNLWPGKFIPPTRACELTMMEQTGLRSANLSLCYKVNNF